jgi:hypothetical protein
MTCTGTSSFRALVFVLALFGSSLGPAGCSGNQGDSGDEGDGDEGPCSQAACDAFCRSTVWGDAGDDPWGRRESACLEDGTCACNDYDCHPDDCDEWCKGSVQADGGVCEIFSCICH